MGRVQPMLATAVEKLPSGPGWAYEFKWDGVRALIDVSDGDVVIRSRAGNDVTRGYPELVALALKDGGAGDVVFDGEIVAFDPRTGRPSFELLQRRMHARGASLAKVAAEVPVTYVAFDILRRYGVDLTARAYVERRATLDRWAEQHPGWTISPFFDDGPATEAAARSHGLEGVVAKRLASTYHPGGRGPDWQKLRFLKTGDFVIIGWESSDERPGVLSSLLLGVAGDAGFEFAGKVGSGLTVPLAKSLQKRLTQVDAPRAGIDRSPGRSGVWVEPEIVVEVAYSGVTEDRRLRQPVFLRVREDKKAAEANG